MQRTKQQKKRQKQQQKRQKKHKDSVKEAKLAANQQKPEKEQEEEQEDVVDFTKPVGEENNEDMDNIEFTFLEPSETMYHSLKNLLAGYSGCTGNQLPQLVDKIIQRKQLSLAIIEDEQDDDGLDTVFSLLGAVELDDQLGKRIKQFFIKKCRTHLKTPECVRILESKQVCLMVNNRFVNLPPKLVPIQHQLFAQQLSELQKKGQLKCQYLICSSNASVDSDPTTANKDDVENLIYGKFEDYQLLTHSQGYWMYADQAKQTGKQSNLSLQFIISVKNYLQCVPRLPQYLE